MSNCKCQDTSAASEAHVPDYSVVGFTGGTAAQAAVAQGTAALEGVTALLLEVCVTASYNAGTNQICFKVPIYGDYCVQSPITIPISASLKACVKTCGSFIPHGLQATMYLNGNPFLTKTLWGNCP